MIGFNINDRDFESLRSMHRISEESAEPYQLTVRCKNSVGIEGVLDHDLMEDSHQRLLTGNQTMI